MPLFQDKESDDILLKQIKVHALSMHFSPVPLQSGYLIACIYGETILYKMSNFPKDNPTRYLKMAGFNFKFS